MEIQKLRNEVLKAVGKYVETAFPKQKFVPGKTYVSATGKVIGIEEISNMVEASMDGWLTTGRFNTMFENDLAKFLSVKHVLTVNSGSSANLVAFSTLTSPKLGERAIKRGDEVISVAAAFPTTVNPILQFGAIPVFVDTDKVTHNIDSSKLEAAITSKTKAIFLAHSMGNPFDLNTVTALCKKYNLWLIEDCCDALGATYNGQKVGSFGDLATLSFYPAHHITMGEGGAVYTNNSELKAIAESFRDWGRDCYCPPGKDNTCGKRFCWKLGDLPEGYDHKYIYSHAGYNMKITDIQASCALAQLKKVENFIEKRRSNFKYLNQKLKSLERYLELPVATENSNPSWFGFPIMLKENSGVSRVDLIRYLEDNLIGTRLLFSGNIVKQPYLKNYEYRVMGNLQNTDRVMNQLFSLGVHPGLDTDHLDYIAQKMEEFFGINF